jgi:hypothetical protein
MVNFVRTKLSDYMTIGMPRWFYNQVISSGGVGRLAARSHNLFSWLIVCIIFAQFHLQITSQVHNAEL